MHSLGRQYNVNTIDIRGQTWWFLQCYGLSVCAVSDLQILTHPGHLLSHTSLLIRIQRGDVQIDMQSCFARGDSGLFDEVGGLILVLLGLLVC